VRLLTLIRHAKSSWDDPGLADIDRPLNDRGKADAPKMARNLSRIGFAPDLVLSSPAKRARRTAKAVIHELKKPPSFAVEPSLYLADPGELLGLIRSFGESLGHVAIVGHNPGLTELANLLGANEIDNVPTAGVVRFELEIAAWPEAGPGCGRMIDFEYPKKSAEAPART
jgi:phosphohistidine phosphatase